MKIAELLRQGGEFLSALDCEVILAHALGCSREYLLAHGEEEVDGFVLDLFGEYVERVRNGEPVAYITGEKEFFGLSFFVDNRVLVPRPETEMIVEKVLEYLGDRKARVLDVGTGSGNIAVSVAKGNEDVDVLALELEDGACEVARLNAEQHGVDDRVNVFQSDLLEAVDEGEGFDVIVANLPYIGEEKHRYVSAATEMHEPHAALFGGFDGLQLYKKMFQELQDKGISFDLMMGEFGFAQGEDMAELLDRFFDQRWVIEKDLAGIERIFCVRGDNNS